MKKFKIPRVASEKPREEGIPLSQGSPQVLNPPSGFPVEV